MFKNIGHGEKFATNIIILKDSTSCFFFTRLFKLLDDLEEIIILRVWKKKVCVHAISLDSDTFTSTD